MHKVGAIPFALKKDQIAVLFVTSQKRGRWIVPKGNLMAGESHKKAANREAFEEAGVKGRLLKDFPVTCLISKSTSHGLTHNPVTFYPLLVEKQLDKWPEDKVRERHWALLRDAGRVVSREDYLALVRVFEQLSPWIIKSSA